MWPRGSKPSITLVDKSDKFVFKPLLYELLNGGATAAEVAPSFQSLLAPYSIRFVQGSVAGVAPEAPLRDGGSAGGGAVTLESGETLGYDWLVVALGAEADARGIPGASWHQQRPSEAQHRGSPFLMRLVLSHDIASLLLLLLGRRRCARQGKPS